MAIVKTNRKQVLWFPVTMHDWLLVSSAFSCLLLLARILVTGSAAYLFLPWNLFLGFIPYCITGRMMRDISLIENRWKFFGSLALWLLFIPNSFYIMTDLFHLSSIDSAPKWFDLLMIFSFAWNGLLFGIISLRRVELLVSLQGWQRFTMPMVFVVMLLSAFGVYIGRFLRFNSWDVLTAPFSLAGEILDMVFHPFENGAAWAMTLVYSVFMTCFYLTLKKLTDAFNYQGDGQKEGAL